MASSSTTEYKAGHGTVTPASSFSADKDAEALRKAMKGIGTNEATLIKILSSRVNSQRQDIKKSYKTLFGRSLKEDIQSETSGNFRATLLALISDRPTFEAKALHKAMKGLGTKESVLIEILATRTNSDMQKIKAAYKKAYEKELEKDIKGDTSGDFERLLVSLCQGRREESTSVDIPKAAADAQALYKAGEGRWGTDESKFNQILVTRSHPQLRATFQEYEKVAKRDIIASIKREMSGDLEDGMIAVAKAAQDMPAFFAEKLYKSMKGLGTDDDTLIRIIVTRCEYDMVEIKDAFNRLYPGKILSKFIKDDLSGDYEKLILALID